MSIESILHITNEIRDTAERLTTVSNKVVDLAMILHQVEKIYNTKSNPEAILSKQINQPDNDFKDLSVI